MLTKLAIAIIEDIAEFSQRYGSSNMDKALEMAIDALKEKEKREVSE